MDKYFHTFSPEETVLTSEEVEMLELRRRDAALDEALRCTFPASDPVALSSMFDSPVRRGSGHHRVNIEFFKHAYAGPPS